MKAILAIIISMTFVSPAFGQGQYRVEFDGSVGSAMTSADECSDIFETSEYHSLWRLTGVSRRLLVSRFDNANDEGFFDGRVFVALYGGMRDFIWDDQVEWNGNNYQVDASGIIDRNVVVVDIVVSLLDLDGNVVCNAGATYSGFN